MPKRNENKYSITVPGEPKEVTEIRKKILKSFKGLEFIEEGHKYFLNGEELPSVSSVVSQYEEEFDADAKAVDYAAKNGETPEYWKDQWKFKNLKSTVLGTLVHEYSESLAWLHMGHPENITEANKCKYIPEKNWLIPTRPKESAALKFFDEFPENVYIVLPETKIYNIGDTIKYAGCFDLLCYYKHPEDDSKSGLIVMDWKSNAQLTKSFSRRVNKMLHPPFDYLYDEPVSAYTLQLNLYSMALEKIGLKVIGRRIIWLKDDETYELIKIGNSEEHFKIIDPKL